MTLDEAQRVGRIVATADGGCPYCACELLGHLAAEFPEFVWSYEDEEQPPLPMSDDRRFGEIKVRPAV